jgi:hypothetical protein
VSKTGIICKEMNPVAAFFLTRSMLSLIIWDVCGCRPGSFRAESCRFQVRRGTPIASLNVVLYLSEEQGDFAEDGHYLAVAGEDRQIRAIQANTTQ